MALCGLLSLLLVLFCPAWVAGYAIGQGVRPVVLWHGLGDSYDSPGMTRITEDIKKEHPGIFVHSVYLDEDSSADSRRSFFGSINEELQAVCEQLSEIPELQNGFDAIGFSQGGLFLRGYIERCNSPPVRKLITYGSPHNGAADLPACDATDFLCKSRNRILKTQLWSSYAQNNVVAAQYFRDPENIDDYLDYSMFLADINNERDEKNATYRSNLSTLEAIVLVQFTEDETLIPKESAWFQEVNRTSGEVTPLEYRDMYREDWIGLKKLVDNELIDYLEIKGPHMAISDKEIQKIAERYLGSLNESPVIRDMEPSGLWGYVQQVFGHPMSRMTKQ